MIPFGEWLPDVPDYKNPGATVAKNVIPTLLGYRNFPSAVDYSSSTGTSRPRGFVAVIDKSGNNYNYTGDATKLYELQSTSWTDRTRTSGAYTTSDTSRWAFQDWGDSLIATNYDDDIQMITKGGTNFSQMSSTAPKAKHIGVVRDFVIVGSVNESGTAVPDKVVWGPQGNPAGSWTADATTMAGAQRLYDGGEIAGIVGGDYGTIFQKNQITRMTFVGSPLIFEFDTVEKNRGTDIPGGIIRVGNLVYYIGNDGFYVFNGQASMNISAEKVARTFFDNYDATNKNLVSVVADPISNLVIWSYPDGGSTVANRLIIYNWALQKWSEAAIDMDLICAMVSPGVTLEGLDSISSSIDALSISLDSTVWQGGAVSLAAIVPSSNDTVHKLAKLDGTSLSWEVETGEVNFQEGAISTVQSVRPVTDGSSIKVQVRHRYNQTDSITDETAIAVNSYDGTASMRKADRYFRFKVAGTGSMASGQGVEVSQVISGGR